MKETNLGGITGIVIAMGSCAYTEAVLMERLQAKAFNITASPALNVDAHQVISRNLLNCAQVVL
jgi:hypothetical protein